MADEGNDGGGIASMDLNLYLGLPRSSRRRVLDLGSDLALGSISLPASSSTEESCAAAPMDDDAGGGGGGSGGVSEPSVAHAPYSPSRASLAPELSPGDSVPVHSRYRPSYDSYIPISGDDDESPERPDDEPYSPSEAIPLDAMMDEGEDHIGQDGILRLQYDDLPSPPPPLVDEPLDLGNGGDGEHSYVPYSPQPLPLSPPSLGLPDDFVADGSSSRQESQRYPHHRFHRIIELNNRRRRLRRFRSSLPYGDQRPVPPHVPEQLLQEVAGKNKAASGRLVSESSDGDSEEKSRSTANFECNVCLELAKEPVVTSCGHLFCWPCLYQWLNIHSEYKECPVCKGEVVESNITPIYGRGSSSEASEEKVAASGAAQGVGDSNLKIPPRPRGNRFESFRQQLRYRRVGEGIASSLRRVVEEGIRRGTRFEVPTVQDMFDFGRHRVLTRLRGLRFQREDDDAELEEGGLNNDLLGTGPSSAQAAADPQNSNSGPGFREDALRRFSSVNGLSNAAADRLAALTTELSRAVELGRLVNVRSRYGGLASVSNPQDPPPDGREVAAALAADQASASSTMAVIEGDAPVPNPFADPNGAGPSRYLRRRGRSSLSGSSDVDGSGGGGSRKRRRLN